ncbi:MAG: hypothetical protein AB7I27_09590 [Bacteriovoracaceae bacterium]
MKHFLIISLMLTSMLSIAETIPLENFQDLLRKNQSTLELITVGMSKFETTDSVVSTDFGNCAFTQFSQQSIIKIENGRSIILSDERVVPKDSICEKAGIKAYNEKILFYEELPSVYETVREFETIRNQIQSIDLDNGNVAITLSQNDQTIKSVYNLKSSIFRYLISEKGEDYSFSSNPIADIANFDLSNVLFCEDNDGDNTECVRGDFSDILF